MEYEYELIDKIKSRPVLFLGEPSITNLQAFLLGYATALYDYKIPNKIDVLLPLPFWFFHEYVARYYNFNESTSGWKNMILNQVNDEEEGLNLFFQLFDEFKQLKVEALHSSLINEEGLDFHYSNIYSPKRESSFDRTEPLYNDTIEIYYAKLSANIGYIGFVRNKEGIEFIRKIYKYENEILYYFQICFGEAIHWQDQKIDHISFQGKYIV